MRLSAALLPLLLLAPPAFAQDEGPVPVTARVDRLEKEMKAVQRKVFPQGTPGYFEPEITAAPPPPPEQVGTPATAPIADLTARVNSLEQELSRITGQVEQQGFKMRQLEESLERLKAETGSRLDVIEGRGAAPAPAPSDEGAPPPPVRVPAGPGPGAAVGSTNSTQAYPDEDRAPPPAAARADPAAGPADPAEDAYMAGYRAWTAKDYPKAEALLKDVAAKYPASKRASYAQNLLGRAYLDEGKPAAAAVAFHTNYTHNPRGERAPDSLYFLGQALMKLDKPNPAKACEAYDALTREYGETITPLLKDRVEAARKDAKCAA